MREDISGLSVATFAPASLSLPGRMPSRHSPLSLVGHRRRAPPLAIAIASHHDRCGKNKRILFDASRVTVFASFRSSMDRELRRLDTKQVRAGAILVSFLNVHHFICEGRSSSAATGLPRWRHHSGNVSGPMFARTTILPLFCVRASILLAAISQRRKSGRGLLRPSTISPMTGVVFAPIPSDADYFSTNLPPMRPNAARSVGMVRWGPYGGSMATICTSPGLQSTVRPSMRRRCRTVWRQACENHGHRTPGSIDCAWKREGHTSRSRCHSSI